MYLAFYHKYVTQANISLRPWSTALRCRAGSYLYFENIQPKHNATK